MQKTFKKSIINLSIPDNSTSDLCRKIFQSMELVTFESKAYQELIRKIERIAEFVVKAEKPLSDEKREVWLDSMEVARLLNISTKTLQRLRREQLISYSMLKGRCLYRLSDIEQALNDRVITCSPQTLDEFRKNYLLHAK
jgi:hypothetical protein